MTDPVTTAMQAAFRGDALDWPTVARVLADEVQRQRSDVPATERLLRAVTKERDALCVEVKLLRSGGLLDLPRLRGIEGRAHAIWSGTSDVHTGIIARRTARYILEGASA